MLEAYEAALSYDRDIADAEHTAAPLFDHLIDDYAEWSPSEMNELISHVLSDHKLTPPCEAKRRMVEQHIECRPLLPHDAQEYYRFCVNTADRGWAYWNFSNVWNMSAQEQDELNQTFLTDNARLYPGNAHPYHMELHREQLVRLINEHVMSGYVATHKHAGRAQILGYCNCGAKETYQGLPIIWREVAEPAEKRVFALTELLVAKPFLACGLEEKLVTHAMEKAREQGFTHAQVFLCEEGFVDGDGSNRFERFLALYTSLGFMLHADRSDAYWRIYILEKAL
jgi:ribosomal protein S18 acetylase RimI-like enzyme